MLFGSYQFVFRLTDEAVLPPYKGSTLRGVFGRSLKRISCVFKRQSCTDCLIKQKCLYALAFETGNVPPPFVLEPPLTDTTRFSKDDLLDFHLILFGEINKSLHQIIYALKEAEAFPVGKRINGKKGSLRLQEVRKDGKTVYSDREQTICTEDLCSELKVPSLKETRGQSMSLKIHLITPLRLKFRNRLNADLPFHVLVRAVLR
jgi:hypothetical protein